MKKIYITIALIGSLMGCQSSQPSGQHHVTTSCNPVDLSYRFCLDEPSRREAADPTIIRFRDAYFLFASKSGGYWHSKDLKDWILIETTQLPVEEYAPTVIALQDTLYFLASSNEKSTIYKSGNPLSGNWTVACAQLDRPVWDPAFFHDDDDRLYLYWGCSNVNPLYGVEVDYKRNFAFVGEPKELKHANPEHFGWEVPGDYNTLLKQSPWIEGSWMNKYQGKYYLQYSGPGTEFKSYADAVYVSDSPLGPFTPQPHNPMAYKPEGFAAGAGHGSTFADAYGNYWHIGTITISQKHMFERRLGLFPAFFDEQGTLYTVTKYGDYPMIIPNKKITRAEEIFPGWMLLSYRKQMTVSSAIDSLPATNSTDENIRTYWSAQTGNAGEYATVDLGEAQDVYALQINFAEHNTNLKGRNKNTFHRYTVAYSSNGVEWNVLMDKSKNETDNTHVYEQLATMISCRYLKITNVQVPDGTFAISDFRVFGKGKGEVPVMVKELEAKRNATNRRSVTLAWEPSPNATGYVISYGVAENQLYNSYSVYADTQVTLNTLDANRKYFFTIEAFNETGITASEIVVVQE